MRNASAFILAPPRARPRPIPGVVFTCERSRDPAYGVRRLVVLSGATRDPAYGVRRLIVLSGASRDPAYGVRRLIVLSGASRDPAYGVRRLIALSGASRDPAYGVRRLIALSGASHTYTSHKTSLPCDVSPHFPFGISLSRVEMFCCMILSV